MIVFFPAKDWSCLQDKVEAMHSKNGFGNKKISLPHGFSKHPSPPPPAGVQGGFAGYRQVPYEASISVTRT